MFKLDKVIGFHAKRARTFFEGTRRLQFVSDDLYARVMQSGATMIRIAKLEDFAPMPYAVLARQVENIALVVRRAGCVREIPLHSKPGGRNLAIS